MQPDCFTCGHFHFLFFCLLLFLITNCSGMFAFPLFNRRKFFLKTVKTFSWSDCKSQFLQNLRGSLCWAPLGFYFPVHLYSKLLGRKNKGKDLTLLQLSLLTATVHLLDQHCSGSQIMPILRLLPELEDETSLKLYLFLDVLQHSPATGVVLVCCCGGFF